MARSKRSRRTPRRVVSYLGGIDEDDYEYLYLGRLYDDHEPGVAPRNALAVDLALKALKAHAKEKLPLPEWVLRGLCPEGHRTSPLFDWVRAFAVEITPPSRVGRPHGDVLRVKGRYERAAKLLDQARKLDAAAYLDLEITVGGQQMWQSWEAAAHPGLSAPNRYVGLRAFLREHMAPLVDAIERAARTQ